MQKQRIIIISLLMVLFFSYVGSIYAVNNGSPANWRYKNGNAAGTKYQPRRSAKQNIDSFEVKWSTPLISGDVCPLVGNLVNNKKLFGALNWSPNEITAFVGDTLFIIDGFGKVMARRPLAKDFQWINEVTVLMDTLSDGVNSHTGNKHIMGLSSVENRPIDSIAKAFIISYDDDADSVQMLARLAVDISDFAPNAYASIIPIGGRRVNDKMVFYATVNQMYPTVDSNYNSVFDSPPYFRGFTQFIAENGTSVFPFSDIGDDSLHRVFFGGDVSRGVPSFWKMSDYETGVLLPCKPTLNLKNIDIESNINSDTYADKAYALSINLKDGLPQNFAFPSEIKTNSNTAPFINSYFVDIKDGHSEEEGFILVTEGYNGLDSSKGRSKIHLLDYSGIMLTDDTNIDSPIFQGDTNHFWSVAVGNIDGNASNELMPWYPNNEGKEIIVTQTSREFSYPGSKLFVLKYNAGPRVVKPDGTGKKLFHLDTIATQRINGWIAAVNDLDNSGDGKDEIVIVDGSRLMILKMRNYNDDLFRTGVPFDTILTKEFAHQTISYVSVADIDGDDRNDVIVTTFDSTYVFGSVIPHTLEMIHPIETDYSLRHYCMGDTLKMQWVNHITGQDFVDIFFRPYEDSIPVPSQDTIIQRMHPNNTDTVNFVYQINSRFLGEKGRFFARSTTKPDLLIDSTAILYLYRQNVFPNTIYDSHELGNEIILSGSTYCNDSLTVEYMDIDSTWNFWFTFDSPQEYDFSESAVLPCLEMFNCFEKDTIEPKLLCRYIIHKSIFADTTAYFTIPVKPNKFPLDWMKKDSANPNIYFSWNFDEIEYACDTVLFSYSYDDGLSYKKPVKIALMDSTYTWRIPKSGPLSVHVRFCCQNSCSRVDTVLTRWLSQYIDVVSPNPMRPYYDKLNIVYHVPVSSTVNIKIIDQNNRLVAHPVKDQYRIRDIMYTDYWNGMREFDNAPCAVGMYYLIIELANGQREIHPIFIAR